MTNLSRFIWYRADRSVDLSVQSTLMPSQHHHLGVRLRAQLPEAHVVVVSEISASIRCEGGLRPGNPALPRIYTRCTQTTHVYNVQVRGCTSAVRYAPSRIGHATDSRIYIRARHTRTHVNARSRAGPSRSVAEGGRRPLGGYQEEALVQPRIDSRDLARGAPSAGVETIPWTDRGAFPRVIAVYHSYIL